MDKRAPIGILPYKQQSLKLVYLDAYNDSKLYSANGQYLSTLKSSLTASKLIYRNTFMKDLELGLEMPYIYNKINKSTSVGGAVNKTESNDGIGDAAIQLTYQIADNVTEPFGAIFGAEIKLPTGDGDKSRGNNAYELIFRSTISKRMNNFIPFVQAIYTDQFDGKTDGVDTNFGDDLYMAIGSKLIIRKRYRVELKYFYDLATSDSYRNMNGSRVRYEGYDIKGYRIKGEIFIGKHIILEAFYEDAKPADHNFYPGNSVIHKKPSTRNRVVTGITYRW